ncbi:MAG: DNA-directed RNA polymerase subunit beta, partial [Bacilli bacterium]
MTRNITKLKKLNNDRIDFSKISGTLPLPNLVEIQTRSYEEFKNQGLDEVFREVFPIVNYTGTMSIEYRKVEFGEPKHPYLECKARDLTYSVPLNLTLGLLNKETGEIQESKVYMGDLPLMTNSGTFIVNGAERVIVSQLVRSPGAYLSKVLDTKSGRTVYGADLIPGRGTWFEFEYDPKKDVFFVRIDRQRKMNAITLLKAIGLDNEKQIIELFGEKSSLLSTLEANRDIKGIEGALIDIFRKLKPGEPVTREGTLNFLFQKFFDEKRYDLGRAGRHKISMKLGIYNRLPGLYLAENLISSEGEVVLKKGELMSKEFVEKLKDEE